MKLFCSCSRSLITMKLLLLLLLLLLLSACDASSIVSGEAGQSVTLPCTYDAEYYGHLSVCWNRGQIPSRGCDSQLLATDGRQVKDAVSSRYQLLGRLDGGDVSLTILNLSEADAGRYGCRVDVPGWFNDDKHHFDLTVGQGTSSSPPSSSSAPWSSSWVTETDAATPTSGHVTSTETSPTRDSDGLSSVQQEGDVLTVVLVGVALGLMFLVVTGGLFVIVRRWRQLNKLPQQQQQQWGGGGAVRFSTTSSTLQLHRRGSAVENVYQIDGSEYEYCP